MPRPGATNNMRCTRWLSIAILVSGAARLTIFAGRTYKAYEPQAEAVGAQIFAGARHAAFTLALAVTVIACRCPRRGQTSKELLRATGQTRPAAGNFRRTHGSRDPAGNSSGRTNLPRHPSIRKTGRSTSAPRLGKQRASSLHEQRGQRVC